MIRDGVRDFIYDYSCSNIYAGLNTGQYSHRDGRKPHKWLSVIHTILYSARSVRSCVISVT